MFDFRLHFNLTVLIKEESKTFHVALNESAVVKAFLSVKVPLFNMPEFSAFFRWYFATFQNNECVIEGFISMADNQSFDNQKDETLEDRLIIKANSDTFASTREISQQIAHMSADGNEDWKMKKVTLPITYGRYQNQQSLSFETLNKQKNLNTHTFFECLNLNTKQKAQKLRKTTNDEKFIRYLPHYILKFDARIHPPIFD